MLEEKFARHVGFCVCPSKERHLKGRNRGPGWLGKPLKVIAVLAVEYPRLAIYAKENLAVRRDLKLVNNWINGKRLTDAERRRVRYLTEFGDKEGQGRGIGSGSFLFHNFKLVMPGWGETNLSELLDSPNIKLYFGSLLGLGKRKVPTGRAVARLLHCLVQNPEIVFLVKTGGWLDLEPFGFDVDGMKEELYKNNIEYQAILDGMMADHGYDECAAWGFR